MLDNVKQWIFSFPCAGGFVVECRIQKSRQPLTDNVRGIYSPTTEYSVNDVVYSGTPVQAYPGWRWINLTPGNSTPTLGADWEFASVFDFDLDPTETFYLDDPLISEDGLGDIKRRSVGDNGNLVADARELGFVDATRYSGTYGDGTPESGDLSGTDYRTVTGRIFDSQSLYTVFFSKVDGTDRGLYFEGDLDASKLQSEYILDYKPGTTDALQKLLTKIQVEGWANRLNTFSIKDFILAVSADDLSDPSPFVGGYVAPGGPYLPERFTADVVKPTVVSGFHISRNNIRTVPENFVLTSEVLATGPSFPSQGFVIPATTSINDGLHAISLSTILSKMAALCNATHSINTKMSIWSDVTNQTTGVITSTEIDIADIYVCYEFLFNVDFRCDLNAAEYDLGGFSWGTSLSELLTWFCRALIVYTQGAYDNLNKRGVLTLADSLSTSGSPLPSNWKPGGKAGIKPRHISAKHIESKARSDEDMISCPNTRGSALPIEIGPRVKKLGRINTNKISLANDIIYNGHLSRSDQWRCWSPLIDGLSDGGHIKADNANVSLISSSGITHIFSLEAPDNEFVVAQEWYPYYAGMTYVAQDVYGADTVYLLPENNDGHFESVLFENGAYGTIYTKTDRNNVEISFIYGSAYAESVPPPTSTANDIKVRIGYVHFRTDLVVTDGSQYVSSATSDFKNYDVHGHSFLGAQVIIPSKGVFKCIEIAADPLGSPDITYMKLDRAVEGSGTGLEILIGGPTISGESWILGSYLYYENTSQKRFAVQAYGDDDTTKALYKCFLHKHKTEAAGNFHGFYALSRMRYADGAVYNPTTDADAPDDTFGNSLKSPTQCSAALNLGNYSLLSRAFVGTLSDAGDLTGYDPLDTWAEHAQGETRSYRAQELSINERKGTVVADLLEFAATPPLDDAHFPIRVIGAGSSGASGNSSGSLGGSGGGGNPPSSSGQSWASARTFTPVTAGTNNDVNFSNASIAVLSSLASAATITGIVGPGADQYTVGLTIINRSGYALSIPNDSASSSAANRIYTGTGATLSVADGDSCVLNYDGENSRWQVVAVGPGGGLTDHFVWTNPALASESTVAPTADIVSFTVNAPSGTTHDIEEWKVNGTIKGGIDKNGNVYERQVALALSNGDNSNIDLSGARSFTVSAPSADFAVTGFAAPSLAIGTGDAGDKTIFNDTAHTLEVKFNDSGSSTANQIDGSSFSLLVYQGESVTFRYDLDVDKWKVSGRFETPNHFMRIDNVFATSPFTITPSTPTDEDSVDLTFGLGTASNGQLLIGNGSGYSVHTLTAGTGITVTNGSGTITIAATGGSGTVTSITAGAGLTTLAANPITTNGTITFDYAYTNTWTDTQEVNLTGLGTSLSPGLTLENTTSATAIAPVQNSASLYLEGRAWNTSGTPASETKGAWITNRPVNGAAPSTSLTFDSGATGGSIVRMATLSSATGLKLENPLDMNSHLINNVTDPSSAQDAATKNYVDTHLPTVKTYRSALIDMTVAGNGTAFTIDTGATKNFAPFGYLLRGDPNVTGLVASGSVSLGFNPPNYVDNIPATVAPNAANVDIAVSPANNTPTMTNGTAIKYNVNPVSTVGGGGQHKIYIDVIGFEY